MIYVLEDDADIRDVVVYALEGRGLKALGCDRPSMLWKKMEEELPALIVLDIMLPEEDGLSVLSKIRTIEKFSKIPVIMLTAKDSEYDKVKGLDGGADDYVVKPFGMLALLARVQALLRRVQEPEDEIAVGGIGVLKSKHRVKVDNAEVELTRKEYELLLFFMDNIGKVYSRQDLLNRVWGYAFNGESRTVDAHIRALRQKLGDSGDCIETVRGVGYRMREEEQ